MFILRFQIPIFVFAFRKDAELIRGVFAGVEAARKEGFEEGQKIGYEEGRRAANTEDAFEKGRLQGKGEARLEILKSVHDFVDSIWKVKSSDLNKINC